MDFVAASPTSGNLNVVQGFRSSAPGVNLGTCLHRDGESGIAHAPIYSCTCTVGGSVTGRKKAGIRT